MIKVSQSISVSPDQSRSVSVRLGQSQAVLASLGQSRSVSVSLRQSWSASASLSQSRPVSASPSQSWSVSISLSQSRSVSASLSVSLDQSQPVSASLRVSQSVPDSQTLKVPARDSKSRETRGGGAQRRFAALPAPAQIVWATPPAAALPKRAGNGLETGWKWAWIVWAKTARSAVFAQTRLRRLGNAAAGGVAQTYF